MRRKEIAAFDLKAEREKRELSQADVAAILCTTQASVSRWESSGMIPDIYRKLWVQHWKLEQANKSQQ
jgi:transcriptional regulator with XRE-family HTH domain